MIFDHLPSASQGLQSAGSQVDPRDTPRLLHLPPSLLPLFAKKKGKTPFSTSPIPPSPPSPAPRQITWRLLGADETIRVCLCWQFTVFTPRESPMTSVSFTPLPSLSHDNLCSGRLSILAITGVSDTIPPRLILPRADGAVGADPSRKCLECAPPRCSSIRGMAAAADLRWGGDRHAA